MKKLQSFLFITLLLAFGSYANAAQFTSGSTGADGAFSPMISTELQLPADGVFNYTTVNIPFGVTVTYKKNSANTPVYILANGDITIAGTIKVDGAVGSSIQPGIGGAGGFNGGFGGTQNTTGSKGIGPGAGTGGAIYCYAAGGGGGGFGFTGFNGQKDACGGNNDGKGGAIYSNDRILPMIGGSGGGGGGGYSSTTGGGGGGGGGAILIASSGTITVTGSITANGGSGTNSGGANAGAGGGGSGGAIKLLANTIAGNGTISASGGKGGTSSVSGGAGGNGRIRLEANLISRTAGSTPAYTFGYPGSVFVANIPNLQITSIGGVNVPSSTTGSYATPDISLSSSTTNPVSVALSASNIPVGTIITVSLIPQFGAATNVNSTPLSGTNTSSTATASVTLSNSYPYIITAQATFAVQTAMFYEGERIDKVWVASSMGNESEAVYITESGKEVPYGALMASLMK